MKLHGIFQPSGHISRTSSTSFRISKTVWPALLYDGVDPEWSHLQYRRLAYGMLSPTNVYLTDDTYSDEKEEFEFRYNSIDESSAY